MTFFALLGITNYEEYSLIQEGSEEKKEEGTGTLKKDRTLLRDEKKMEKLKAKLHTDDDCELLPPRVSFPGIENPYVIALKMGANS